MSIPDINQIMNQVGLFLQNPQAFENMLESLNLPEEKKTQLRAMFKQFAGSGQQLDPNVLNLISQMMSNLSKSGLPPQLGNLESIMEMFKNNPPSK